MGRSMKMGCLVVLGILALGIILSMVNDGGGQTGGAADPLPTEAPAEGEQTSQEEAPAEEQSNEEQPASDARVSADGDIVVNNEVRWKILEAQVIGPKLELEDGSVKPLEADGAFVGVRFELQNVSQNPLTFLGMALVDDKKKEYNYLADALPFVVEEEACETVNLEPEQTQTCTAIYDVPADANGLAAVVTDLNLAGGQQEAVPLGIE